MKAVKLYFGTHRDNGMMYRVYQNQGQELISLGVTSLDMFYNLPWMKYFRSTFLKNCKGYKVETCTHMDSGLMYCVYRNQGQGPITFEFKSFFFLLLQFAINKKLIGLPIYHQWNIFVIDFSGTMKAVMLIRSTHIDSGLMYRVYQNQARTYNS